MKGEKMSFETMKIGLKSHYIAAFFLVAFAGAALLLTVDNGGSIGTRGNEHGEEDRRDAVEGRLALNESSSTAVTSRCDLFVGKWIYDNVTQPPYEEGECSFLKQFDLFSCEKHGRKDFEYQKWRWKPRDCPLPRFNGRVFMEKMRGKRVVFVGDSLNRNQWLSLLCLIESSLDPSSEKSVIKNDNLFVFKSTEYNATIEFYWSPFLVESNSDDPFAHSSRNHTVGITSIEKHARRWNDADVLIFNTFMWWLEPSMTLLWGSFGSSDAIYKKVEMKLRRFEMALTPWSDWLEININRTKTKMFFTSLSPYHFHEAWDDECNCYNETEPVSKEGYWGIGTDRDMMQVVESVLQKLGTRGLNVAYLNITHLSDYRKDAHLSIYRKFHQPLTKEQLSNPISYLDCVHWCLPGVPDVWNDILYSYFIDS